MCNPSGKLPAGSPFFHKISDIFTCRRPFHGHNKSKYAGHYLSAALKFCIRIMGGGKYAGTAHTAFTGGCT